MSSTLRELREERGAARDAIRNLRLTPVLFELGARPYPPRALYRAYLEQSQVFIGIYWQQYGWVAPDMDISGLEDEYGLSTGKPRLIYIREPAPDREPRLHQLLDQIRQEGQASYKSFHTSSELKSLIEEDLALLLSERFERLSDQQVRADAVGRTRAAAIPIPTSRFIGRERDLQSIHRILEQADTRLVTLTGMGGIGKTRLALRVAHDVQERFAEGARIVALDTLNAPTMVVPAILQAFGLEESSERSPLELLIDYLQEREMLLVLDSFEHVIGAAPLVGELLERCPRVKALVTSREALQISGEHRFEVPPLVVPEAAQDAAEKVVQSEAVRLFVDRAQAVQGDFQLDDSTAPVVAEIVRRLEGLPLAIELAAARTQMLPLPTILQRLNSRLQLLTRGPRDLPVRQQTMKNTIDWSYGLLDEHEKGLFTRLSVFVGGWTLDAVEAVCAPFEHAGAEETLSSLIDKSLARPEGFAGEEPRFSMLDLVREYAQERLRDREDVDRRRDLHAEYFLDLAKQATPKRVTAPQVMWLERLAAESGNFRAAIRWLLDRPAPGRAAQLGSALWNCWWLRSRLPETVSWMSEVLAASNALSVEERALASMLLGLSSSGLGDYPRGLHNLRQAHALYSEMGDRVGVAGALAGLGVVTAITEDPSTGERMVRDAVATFKELERSGGSDQSPEPADPLFYAYASWGLTQTLIMQGRGREAIPFLEEVAAWAKQSADVLALSVTVVHLGMARLDAGEVPGAHSALMEGLHLARDLHGTSQTQAWQGETYSEAAMAYALEALSALAAATTSHESGALLLGAAHGIRRSVRMATWAPYRYMNERTEGALRTALGDSVFRAKLSEGEQMTPDQAAALAATLN